VLIPIYFNSKDIGTPMDLLAVIFFLKNSLLIKYRQMSNSENGSASIVLMWLATLGFSIGSGIMAWNWIEPENVFHAIGFLLTWLILSKVGHFYALGFVAIVEGMN